MSPTPGSLGQQAASAVISRLKFPQAFALFLILFLLDLAVPDLIPFADEILLALAATVFGLWREKVPAPGAPPPPPGVKPPEKNVTPSP